MSIEQTDVVDIMSTDRASGHVVLTISDHLDWSDSVAHQRLLQNKLNRYLAFVESGEILQSYPDAKDRLIAFKVFFGFRQMRRGERFWPKSGRLSSRLVSACGMRYSPVRGSTESRLS